MRMVWQLRFELKQNMPVEVLNKLKLLVTYNSDLKWEKLNTYTWEDKKSLVFFFSWIMDLDCHSVFEFHKSQREVRNLYLQNIYPLIFLMMSRWKLKHCWIKALLTSILEIKHYIFPCLARLTDGNVILKALFPPGGHLPLYLPLVGTWLAITMSGSLPVRECHMPCRASETLLCELSLQASPLSGSATDNPTDSFFLWAWDTSSH